MRKKIRDLTYPELVEICGAAKDCPQCQLNNWCSGMPPVLWKTEGTDTEVDIPQEKEENE